MHEVGITREIIGAVLESAEQAGATRINSVRVTIGELTEIVPDAIQFAWETLTPGSALEGVVLTIDHVPARSKCLECGNEFDHDRWDRLCPSCGSFLIESLSGRELLVSELDVELPDERG